MNVIWIYLAAAFGAFTGILIMSLFAVAKRSEPKSSLRRLDFDVYLLEIHGPMPVATIKAMQAEAEEALGARVLVLQHGGGRAK